MRKRSAATVSTLVTPGIVDSRRAMPLPSASTSTTKPAPSTLHGKLGDRAHHHDAAGLEQRDAIADALHLIEQM